MTWPPGTVEQGNCTCLVRCSAYLTDTLRLTIVFALLHALNRQVDQGVLKLIEKGPAILLRASLTHTIDLLKLGQAVHLALYHYGHLLIGEERIDGHSLLLGQALAQITQPGVEGEVAFTEYLLVVNLATLLYRGGPIRWLLIADTEAPVAVNTVLNELAIDAAGYDGRQESDSARPLPR